MQIINVCLIADDSYAQHTAVTITSFVKNNPNLRIKIWLITTGFSSQNIQYYGLLSENLGFEFQIILFDVSKISTYDGIGPWSKYTFMKIYIGGLLPASVEKILYLDSDMVVLDSVKYLFDIKMDSYALAAVSDVASCVEHKKRCKLPETASYINSGVMWMNLDYWRKAEEMKSFEHFINVNRGKISLCDQDVINSVFCDRIFELPLNYNVVTQCFGINPYKELTQKQQIQLKTARKHPIVVHFVNAGKPWLKEYYHQYKWAYYKYLKMTPYKSFTPVFSEKKGYKDMIEKYTRGIVVKIIDYFRF